MGKGLSSLRPHQRQRKVLRFDFYSDGSGLRLFAASFSGGSPSVEANQSIRGGTPLYMRGKHSGNQWTQFYSYDGITRMTDVSFTHALTVTSVGPFASNAGSPAPAFTGLVDYFFNAASPIVPGD